MQEVGKSWGVFLNPCVNQSKWLTEINFWAGKLLSNTSFISILELVERWWNSSLIFLFHPFYLHMNEMWKGDTSLCVEHSFFRFSTVKITLHQNRDLIELYSPVSRAELELKLKVQLDADEFMDFSRVSGCSIDLALRKKGAIFYSLSILVLYAVLVDS